MAFDIMAEIGKLTGQVTDSVTTKAKEQVISTLNDPEVKKSVNKFVSDFIEEHKVFLATFFGACVLLSTMAIVNIISNFSSRR